MEVPAPFGGVVKTIHVKCGDKVSEGKLIVTVEVEEKTHKSSSKKGRKKKIFGWTPSCRNIVPEIGPIPM